MISRRWGAENWPGDRLLTNHAALTLYTPPAVEPVSLSEVKRYLRIDFDTDDPLLDVVIQAARSRLEAWLRRALITQTWDLTLDWGPAWVELPYPPLQTVDGIYIRQLDQSEATVDPATYYTNAPARMVGLVPSQVWPTHITPFGWRCRFTCGYGDGPEHVPAAIKLSLYNMIAFAYENRTTINEVPSDQKEALQSYRIQGAPWRMAKGLEPPELLA